MQYVSIFLSLKSYLIQNQLRGSFERFLLLLGILPVRQRLGHFIEPLRLRFVLGRLAHSRANATTSRVLIP